MLLAAIVLAVLYFGLMELLLIDSARELNEAQRFRSRIVAAALAENAAEHMALGIIGNPRGSITEENAQGHMTARLTASPQGFTIVANGVTKGVKPQRARVLVQGLIEGTSIRIDFTQHSQ